MNPDPVVIQNSGVPEVEQRCPICAPGYDRERDIYELTADSALDQIEALRRGVLEFRDVLQQTTCPTYIGALDAADVQTRLFDALNRIEQYIRDGAR